MNFKLDRMLPENQLVLAGGGDEIFLIFVSKRQRLIEQTLFPPTNR